ncbi:unnamed protein product [Arabis nemorensis]|uniref:Uncharacterized protein n=1 Tax=Arabis nemorensis TaxID=586526 RepID=A0A565C2Q1_9BRAS|nr:unnamed protein product [Arabis nemorensis]
MAKEIPQASDENELEIEVEESEEDRSDDSSSEEDESSESDAESETGTVIKHTIQEVTSRKRRFEEANEGGGEGDWFEKSFLFEGMEERRLARRKAKFLRDLAAALARVVVP